MNLIAQPTHNIVTLRSSLESARMSQAFKPSALNERLIAALEEAILVKEVAA